MQRNPRCSEHEDEADACAALKRHLKLPDRTNREKQQDDVEGHTGAVQCHLYVIVVPVVEVELPFQWVPGLV